jgi:hypothetical protein
MAIKKVTATIKKATKKKSVLKKKMIKKVPIEKQIMDIIEKTCQEHDDLLLYDINNSYAFIIKRVPVTTFHVQNASLFCPRDHYSEKVFFTAFYVLWESANIELSCFMPTFKVMTPKEAEIILLSYSGESIPE